MALVVVICVLILAWLKLDRVVVSVYVYRSEDVWLGALLQERKSLHIDCYLLAVVACFDISIMPYIIKE